VHFDLTEKIKKAFDANGVSIPFPQRDVHVYQHGAEAQEKSA
jgi:small conductance mechanosensitive channel